MIWEQIVAAVVAGLVPVVVKIASDWHRVALTRAGHGDIASGEEAPSTARAAPPPRSQSRSRTTPETPSTPRPETPRPSDE